MVGLRREKEKEKKKQYFLLLFYIAWFLTFSGFSFLFVSFCFFCSFPLNKVFLCFDDLDDVKNLIRNAERLFPEAIEGAWGLIVLFSLFVSTS